MGRRRPLGKKRDIGNTFNNKGILKKKKKLKNVLYIIFMFGYCQRSQYALKLHLNKYSDII